MKDQLQTPNNGSTQNSAPPPDSEASSEAAAGQTAESGAGPALRVVRPAPAHGRRPAKRPAMARQRPGGRPSRPPRPAQPSHTARTSQSGQAARSSQPAPQSGNVVDEDDDGFFARHRSKVIFGIIAVLAGGAAYFVKTSKPAEGTKAAPPMVSIKLPPLPPPPPPPKPPPPKVPPPPTEQKMIQETAAEEKKAEDPKPPAPAPTEALGTNLKGDGPGMAGLGGSGNGGGFGGPRGGGNGSKWGWYAGQVQSSVAAALKRNNKTRTASMKIQVRIWPNAAGRVTRAQLDGTTGDHALDEALQEILNGLQLQEPPPAGMPSPIVLRLTAARRP